ncbi:hypothetical protein [Moraxella catarrhalis]|uniref:Uncharacterized protein n=1 Tax=Moraxella catarrhalis TaxID=480 RepID=A0A198UQM0_MORCA|nr:hypothetical protein [Moraxella catarrhalis]OAU97552.1 hypothetical protein AO384_0588 [Moraxella catarrhalis]
MRTDKICKTQVNDKNGLVKNKKLTLTKIHRVLMTLKFSTAHALDAKNNTICHLLTYERSLASDGQVNLSALFAVYQHLLWLLGHVREIDDKQVLPSQRLFLADAMAFIFNIYEQQSQI